MCPCPYLWSPETAISGIKESLRERKDTGDTPRPGVGYACFYPLPNRLLVP